MSVIAWDGQNLAADKRMTSGDGLIRTVTKVAHFQWGDGQTVVHVLAGYCGDTAVAEQLLAWFQDGAAPEEFPESARKGAAELLVVTREWGLQHFTSGPEPLYLEDAHVALGAGRDFALAAMSMGMNAAAAVDLASKHNAFCGGGIDVVSFPAETSAGKTVH